MSDAAGRRERHPAGRTPRRGAARPRRRALRRAGRGDRRAGGGAAAAGRDAAGLRHQQRRSDADDRRRAPDRARRPGRPRATSSPPRRPPRHCVAGRVPAGLAGAGRRRRGPRRRRPGAGPGAGRTGRRRRSPPWSRASRRTSAGALLAEGTYAVSAGLPWIATNLDVTVPTPRGIAPGNGALVGVVARGRRPATRTRSPASRRRRCTSEAVRRTGANDSAGGRGPAGHRHRGRQPGRRTQPAGPDRRRRPADLLRAEAALRPTYLARDLRDGLLAAPGCRRGRGRVDLPWLDGQRPRCGGVRRGVRRPGRRAAGAVPCVVGSRRGRRGRRPRGCVGVARLVSGRVTAGLVPRWARAAASASAPVRPDRAVASRPRSPSTGGTRGRRCSRAR